MDWGHAGLDETLRTLRQAGIHTAGAGCNAVAACAPVILPFVDGQRVLVFSWATDDSGLPAAWNATGARAGIALLPDLSDASARQVASIVSQYRRPGDRVVISLHWGSNRGLEAPPAQRRFARCQVDLAAVDLVHGHSSHPPRPAEVHRGRLILYGCGDLINDYEGITSQARFDHSTVCLYFARLARGTGELLQLEIIPMQLRRFRLVRANLAARRSLQKLFESESCPLNTGVQADADGNLQLRW